MAEFKRKRLFVDRSVQGAFMLRATLHWLACVLSLSVVYVAVSLLVEPVRLIFPDVEGIWFLLAPAVVTTLLLLPVIVYDTIKLTHRLVGPLLRLRRAMRELAAGQPVERIRFRDGDFWREFADEFNAIADRIERSTPAAEPTAAEALASR
ncbi:MAG TPA: hypothetical protein VMV69_15295 [Pirellulales bacterium]|nr:hypothetical protein [Pirellulales bacterium]